MFWIGIIIGIIIGMTIVIKLFPPLAAKLMNISLDEFKECIELIDTAGSNRASTMMVYHDGEVLNTVELEEK